MNKLDEGENFFREIVTYGICGILTVVINMAAFYWLDSWLQSSIIWSNTIAFVIAVLFAYWSNTKIVFQTEFTFKNFSKFWLMRIGTLIIDDIGMIILVSLSIEKMIAKFGVNIIIILVNYLCSKFIVFKK